MLVTFTCPICSQRLQTKDVHINRVRRVGNCPICRRRLQVQSTEQPPTNTSEAPNDTPPPQPEPWSVELTWERLFIVLSWIWVVTLTVSNLKTMPGSLWATMGLLSVNFLLALHILIRQKRLLLWLNVAQVALFGALFAQVFYTLAPQYFHYRWNPGFFDWAQFIVAHVIRAVDFLDFLESLGISLQNVKSNHLLPNVLLVFLHWTVGIFLIAFLFRGLAAVGKWLIRQWKEEEPIYDKETPQISIWTMIGDTLKALRGTFLGICFILFVLCAFRQQWTWSDMLLWPLDNLLRVIDLGDTMQILHCRLHGVEHDTWSALLSVFFRFCIGLYVIKWMKWLILKSLGGMTPEPLEVIHQDLQSESPEIREASAKAVGEMGEVAIELAPDLVPMLADEEKTVRETAQEALQNLGPFAQSAVTDLVKKLVHVKPTIRLAAHETLMRIHPRWAQTDEAKEAIPHLIEALSFPPELCRCAIEVLEAFGKAARPAIPALIGCLLHPVDIVRMQAMIALQNIDKHWAANPYTFQAFPQLKAAMEDERTRSMAIDVLSLIVKYGK